MASEPVFGEIEGVKEGDVFKDRAALTVAGVHRNRQQGIDGNPKFGAASIVLNGGYVDDFDEGEDILYTGHGGNDPNTKRQVADQSWESTGNKALIVSEMMGLPVRVTRGSKHKSDYSPSSGYEYAGLYYVEDHMDYTGADGFKVCRYRLTKASPSKERDVIQEIELPEGRKETKRIKTTTQRIIRDTKVSKAVKKLYDYACQVCGERLAVRGIPYAEGAHIKPLGKPHNGADDLDNLLCLCPNHHVLLDKGGICIDSNLQIHGAHSGKLMIDKRHLLDTSNFDYHAKHIYIND